MPSLSQFFNSLRVKEYSSVVDQTDPSLIADCSGSDRRTTITSHYLATFPLISASPLLQSLTLPLTSPQIPSGSLYFRLSHPSSSEPTCFFLDCLPDPIGFLAHSAYLIRSHLGSGSSGPSKWRHDALQLILEDHDGLAHTCGGDIHVSLKWVGDIMRQVQDDRRDQGSAIKEFKGVLLHELVHAIQYDGQGTTPTWLIESIADYVRLKARLGPPHWRNPGQGRDKRGWEEGYDAGAQFLSWLVGPSTLFPRDSREQLLDEMIRDPDPFVDDGRDGPATSATVTAPPLPQSTKYPDRPHPNVPARIPAPHRPRPGPWRDIVKDLNGSLEHEKYKEGWWERYTGVKGGLEGLWAAYMGFYR